MASIRKTEIENAILDGVVFANRDYERWSGGWWLTDSGVEGILQVRIANVLADRIEGNGGGAYVWLEDNLRKLFHNANQTLKKTRRSDLAIGGGTRPDISVIGKQDEVLATIEIKRNWNEKLALKDIARCRDLVTVFGASGSGELRSAHFGAFVACESPKFDGGPLDTLCKDTEAAITSLLDSTHGHRPSGAYRWGMKFGPAIRADTNTHYYGELGWSEWMGRGLVVSVS